MLKFEIEILDKNSIDNAIKRMYKLQNRIYEIQRRFIKRSLEWIRDRANELLKERVYNFPDTANVKDGWKIIEISKDIWQLVNENPLAGYIEFGVGLKGKLSQHKAASDVNYQYDVNNHGESGWNWYNEDLGVGMKGFTGYKGKSFLYDSFFEYQYNDINEMLLEELLKEGKLI